MIVPEGETKEFLGQEFLTWLWYYGESNGWALKVKEGDELTYWMDDLLVLKPDDVEDCSQRLAGTGPITSSEAQAGLKKGKKVSTTRITLVYKDRDWSFTLAADTFNFTSLHLMQPTSTNPQDRFLELADDLEQVVSTFKRVYNHFLSIRLSPAWKEKELPAIREWIFKRQATT